MWQFSGGQSRWLVGKQFSIANGAKWSGWDMKKHIQRAYLILFGSLFFRHTHASEPDSLRKVSLSHHGGFDELGVTSIVDNQHAGHDTVGLKGYHNRTMFA